MKKELLLVLVLAVLAAAGAFAQSVGGTYTLDGQTWVVITLIGDTMVLQRSPEAVQSAPSQGAPAAPTGLKATAVSSNRIDLSWNAVPGATGYRLYVGLSPTGTFSLAGSETKTSTSTYNIPANTTCYYKLTAFNSNGESPFSSVASATTFRN